MRPSLVPACVALVAAVTVGCSKKVEQNVFDQTVAELRGEMQDLDDRVTDNSNRISEQEALLAALRSDLEALAADFDDMQAAVVELEDGLRFVTPVHFDFDRADIRPEDEPILERFTRVVEEYYPVAVITVEGFADPAGPAEYNRRLSERRANNVAEYLTSRGGLPAEGIRIAAYGEDRQVVEGAQGPGRAGLENRRVTFVIEMSGPLTAELVTTREDGGLR
ncbi:MAG: OmpA family protein [Gemmatimonadota bacterium]|nr:OmpA family protein [Gemmatimonadota bacterium]